MFYSGNVLMFYSGNVLMFCSGNVLFFASKKWFLRIFIEIVLNLVRK